MVYGVLIPSQEPVRKIGAVAASLPAKFVPAPRKSWKSLKFWQLRSSATGARIHRFWQLPGFL